MSTNPHDDPDRDRERVDWDRYEHEVADVVDLDAERERRQTDTDEDSGPGRSMVDSVAAQRRPRFTLTGIREAQRRPIVPGWLRSRAELAANAGWAAGFALHALLYHLIRAPKYAAKMVVRAPRGLFRALGGYFRWLFDLEGEPVRQATVRSEDADAYLKLSRQRDRRVRWRGLTALFTLAALLVSAGAVYLAPDWAQWTVLALTVAVLGVYGTPADKPLLDTAVVRTSAAPLTSDVVIAALAALGIKGITQAIARGDTGKRWFPAPITREGGGWRADVELPGATPAAVVVDKREELAAALARPLGCVWPEVNAEVHPGRLILFVADKDMSKAKQATWPLLKTGRVDLFAPFAFGTDPRGRLVTLTLMFASMIIGSVPRMGKTFALRLALLAAALDPRAWVYAFDLKGTGDLSPLEQVAHRYRAGDDEEDIAYGVAAMRELHAEMRRRTKVIRELPKDLCPENKVTPELANVKRYGLHPIVAGCDECQVWFEHPRYGAELVDICTDLVKRGPATGITLILATQRPDADSIPPAISANAILRFCPKVMGWRENDMVLGNGLHGNGIKATMFSRRDRGIGYLAGEGDDPVIARTFRIDNPTAEQVARRARTLREAAGTITGHAAGHMVDTAAVRRDTLLDDLAVILTDSEPKLWTEIVVERLAGLRPDVYAGMTREQLTAALKVWDVSTGQVWGTDPDTSKGANRRGIDRKDILKAITKRDRGTGGRAAS